MKYTTKRLVQCLGDSTIDCKLKEIKYTKEQLVEYLIECKGYTEEDCNDQTVDLQDLIFDADHSLESLEEFHEYLQEG